jgi:hypothetical protein
MLARDTNIEPVLSDLLMTATEHMSQEQKLLVAPLQLPKRSPDRVALGRQQRLRHLEQIVDDVLILLGLRSLSTVALTLASKIESRTPHLHEDPGAQQPPLRIPAVQPAVDPEQRIVPGFCSRLMITVKPSSQDRQRFRAEGGAKSGQTRWGRTPSSPIGANLIHQQPRHQLISVLDRRDHLSLGQIALAQKEA